MQREWRISICNVRSQDLSFDCLSGTSLSWDLLFPKALWGGRCLPVMCVSRATCRAAPPPAATPAGAVAFLLPGTSSLSASPATLISLLLFHYFCYETTRLVWFSPTLFPSSLPGKPQLFFSALLTVYCPATETSPIALLPVPGMSSGMHQSMRSRVHA